MYRELVREQAQRATNRLLDAKRRTGRTDAELLLAWGTEVAAALQLERASRSIFQSQLDALDALKSGPPPLTTNEFKPFYERAKIAAPWIYQSYSFEEWINFLRSFELIVGADDNLQITDAGRVLGHYMSERGYGRGFVA